VGCARRWRFPAQHVLWVGQPAALARGEPLRADQHQHHYGASQSRIDLAPPAHAGLQVVDVAEHDVVAEAQAQVVGQPFAPGGTVGATVGQENGGHGGRSPEPARSRRANPHPAVNGSDKDEAAYALRRAPD
jgi:hypothetical protein